MSAKGSWEIVSRKKDFVEKSKKPKGWVDEPGRHSLAARGIPSTELKQARQVLRKVRKIIEAEGGLVSRQEYDSAALADAEDILQVFQAKDGVMPKSFTIDLKEFLVEDDGEEAFYGGQIVVNGVVLPGRGSDRTDNVYTDVIREVTKQLGRKLSDDEHESLYDSMTSIVPGGILTWST